MQSSKIQVDNTSGEGVNNPTSTLPDTANPDISTMSDSGELKIYIAQKIITMEAAQPEINPATTPEGGVISEERMPAVAVQGDTILAVGILSQVKNTLRELGKTFDEDKIVDRTFRDKVIMPGFVEHHLHPLLGAMTMAVEVISIEDWTLPGKKSEAAHNEQDYKDRLVQAHKLMDQNDPEQKETLFTWGLTTEVK
ncbi:MAG: hypothetical protein F6K18_12940 [Okeania sp. SIO2C2]|nr:hypothetical protein [Okeania sp. SIO2C2]